MIRIAIDMSALMPQHTGCDRYFTNLIHELGKLDHHNAYRIYANFEDREVFRSLPPNFAVKLRCSRSRSVRLLFQQLWLPAATAGWADVIHAPSFIMPFLRWQSRCLLTVQDMSMFSHPHYHSWLHRTALFRLMMKKSIEKSDLIKVPSIATKQELLGVIPRVPAERVVVIGYGVDDSFRPRQGLELEAVRGRLGLPERYVLYVGTVEPRKNLERLVICYERVCDESTCREDLVIAGGFGWQYEALMQQIRESNVANRIHMIGYVAPADLPYVYSGATIFAYPSITEGYGLPPLEAMACGVPTITSNNSSLIENYADAAVLVAADNTDSIASAMLDLLSNEAQRQACRTRGLALAASRRWCTTAKETLNCYLALANGHSAGNREH